MENHGCVAGREMSAVGGEEVRIVQVMNIGNSVSENNDQVFKFRCCFCKGFF